MQKLKAVVCAALLLSASSLALGAANASAYQLTDVQCPSTSQCTAIDSGGREVTFDPAAASGAGLVTIDGSQGLTSIACPSTTQCTTIDDAGNELTFDPGAPSGDSTAALGVDAVVCPSTSQCTAIAADGREVTFDPSSPGDSTSAVIDSSAELTAIACSSASQCTAIDEADYGVTFDPSSPSDKTRFPIDSPQGFCGVHCSLRGLVTAIACPSSSQCTAVDDSGREVTFDPTAPREPEPTSITVNPVFFGGLVEVACPSTGQCTATERDGREVTFDPDAPDGASPVAIDEQQELGAVACPSSTQCTTIDATGAELTFDPLSPSSLTREVIDGEERPPTKPGEERPTGQTIPSQVHSVPHDVGRDRARAARLVRVRGGVAKVELDCPGSGPCTGEIVLRTRVFGRAGARGGWRHASKRRNDVAIGRASFSLAGGSEKQVAVRLTPRGETLLVEAGKMEARLAGRGVQTRSLVLRPRRATAPRADAGRGA